MNQATHNQITALQVVVSALAMSQKDNPEFNALLAMFMNSAAWSTYSAGDQASVKTSIERLIGHDLPG